MKGGGASPASLSDHSSGVESHLNQSQSWLGAQCAQDNGEACCAPHALRVHVVHSTPSTNHVTLMKGERASNTLVPDGQKTTNERMTLSVSQSLG